MSRGQRTSGISALVDLAAIVTMSTTSLVSLVAVFGGWSYVPAALAGLFAGSVLAWLGARWSWSAPTVALGVVIAVLGFGGPFAYPETTIAGVVPTGETIREVALGVIHTWKGFLTSPVPVINHTELVLVPLLLGLLVTTLAGSIALRARQYGATFIPLITAAFITVAFSGGRPAYPVIQGLTFVVTAISWTSWRWLQDGRGLASAESLTDLRRLRRRRVLISAAMLTTVGVAANLIAPAIIGTGDRRVLRDFVTAPLDLHDHPSPLESFRQYTTAVEEPLFSVDGLPAGERLRLAVLDTYTGTVLDVAGGSTQGGFVPAATVWERNDESTSQPVKIGILGYSGVWLPTVGVPTQVQAVGDRSDQVDAGLYVNPLTSTALTTVGLQAGDSYTVQTVISPTPSWDEFETAQLVLADTTEQYQVSALAQTAQTIVGDETDPAAQVRLIVAALTADGVLSHGLDGQPVSPPGHGAWRLTQFISAEHYVGDDEQFAVAAALMIGALGYSVRVVMGFVPSDPTDGAVTITGADVRAWVEVNIAGVGWVPVDVTPSDNHTPEEQDPRTTRDPEIAALPDPPPPKELSAPVDPTLTEDQRSSDAPVNARALLVLRIAIGVAVPLILLAAPLFIVVGLKIRRRQQRRRAAETVSQVSGAWNELTDTAIDLGTVVDPTATRREVAHVLQEPFGGTQVIDVAQRIDRVVFGTGEPSSEDATRFWAEVDELLSSARVGVSRWRWWRARWSLRSFKLVRGSPTRPEPSGVPLGLRVFRNRNLTSRKGSSR